MRRREAEYVVEEGKTGDPQSLELVMLLAWSVSTDPPAGISEAGRPREGVSSPHHGASRGAAAVAAQGVVGWAPSLSPCMAMHCFELSK